MDLELKEIEVQKLNLKQNDVLMVTIQDENIEPETLKQLSEQLKKFFPDNKVALFALSTEGYVKFTVASVEPPVVQSYCTDCSCGKKQQIEGNNESK